ncbi:MAG: alpha-glucosidase, partial [Flaviramulus sp.]
IYAYTRKNDNDNLLVLLNFTDHDSSITLSETNSINDTLINNYDSLKIDNETITLKPYQAIIVSLGL